MSWSRQCEKGWVPTEAIRRLALFARVRDRGTNLRAQLDDRLVHFRLDLFFQQDLAALEDFLDVRTELARLRIDNREFLFDPERERMVRGGHGCAINVSQKLRAVMRASRMTKLEWRMTN